MPSTKTLATPVFVAPSGQEHVHSQVSGSICSPTAAHTAPSQIVSEELLDGSSLEELLSSSCAAEELEFEAVFGTFPEPSQVGHVELLDDPKVPSPSHVGQSISSVLLELGSDFWPDELLGLPG
jgi:hypothetical protein